MKKKRSRETTDILTGAAVMAAIAVWFAWSYVTSISPSGDGYAVQAQYRNVDGITTGSEVRMAGVLIGAVTAIDYDPSSNRAVLEMTIRDGVQIPTDSAAKIVSESMLGSKFVKIEPGGDEANIKTGARFRFVQNSVVVEEVLQRLIIEVEASRAAKKAKKNSTE